MTGGEMQQLRNIPMATLAVAVGIVSAVAWIALDGTVPLIVSVVGGGLIAIKATLAEDE